jgi:hypothetical protein
MPVSTPIMSPRPNWDATLTFCGRPPAASREIGCPTAKVIVVLTQAAGSVALPRPSTETKRKAAQAVKLVRPLFGGTAQ